MTIITLGLISFVNLFFVPVIGLSIYCKRHEIEECAKNKRRQLYVLFAVMNFLLTQIFLDVVEKLLGLMIHLEMSKYTLAAVCLSVLLAFVFEGVEKYIQVNVSVSVQEPKKRKKNVKGLAKNEEAVDEA